MTAPAETERSSARAWVASALVLAGAAWLVVGLLVVGSDANGELALAVAPAVLLVAAGSALALR